MNEIPGILGEIVAKRLGTIEQAKQLHSLEEIRSVGENSETPLSLQESLSTRNGISLIAEMKRSSPSAGSLDPDLDPAQRATLYCGAGAAAISVLTEHDYFSGSIEDLTAATRIARPSNVPVLRKDVNVEEYQFSDAR